MYHGSCQHFTGIGIPLGDDDIASVAGVNKGHSNFSVAFYKVREFLHLGITLGCCGGGDFLRAIRPHDSCCGGCNGHGPGLYMGHTGVGRMDSGCLGGGVKLVVQGRLRLLNCHLDRIMVVLRVCPGEQLGTAIHFNPLMHLGFAV